MITPPQTPPFTADLPGIGGQTKATPESFVVEEIPAYEPSGEGDHLYLWIEKRDVSASQLIQIVAHHFHVSRNDVGAAGNKDRRAITRQWISIPAPSDAVTPGVIADGVELLRCDRHRNKLRTNHLRGNRFEIELHDVALEPDAAVERASRILDQLAICGVPNYFGTQRFGRDGSTLRDGVRLLRGEMPAKLRKDRRLRRLAASAVQSAVFNEVLRARIADRTTHTALCGDRLNRTTERGQLLVTADNIVDAQAGIDAGTLGVTGPMWGPKMYEVAADALEVELTALSQFELTSGDFMAHAKLTPGTRRDLFARFLDPPRCSAIDGGVRVGFSLPSGAYATVVLAELTKLDFSAWAAP